jgi:chaperonin GroEL (HSP60 family)
LTDISTPVDLNDRDSLLRAASTSLNSKIVSQYSSVLAPIAVSAVTRLLTPTSSNVDLRDIRLVKKVGGTIEDTELIEGLALKQVSITSAGGPSRIEKARIGLIQFQLSSPKPDMDNQIVVNDYRQMDKILKEERQYLLNLCKRIKKTGCNVLLIQKSILRDAVTDLSLHFLAKLKIMVVKDVERDEIDFIAKSTGCKPVADIEAFTEDKLGYAELVEEASHAGAKVVKVTGVKNPGKTVSVVCTGANALVLEESERSLHDALCVVRCLVKKRCVRSADEADKQSADCRRRCARDSPLAQAHSIRPNAQGQRVVLLPSVCRGPRSHPDYLGGECGSQPDCHCDGAAKQACEWRAPGGDQCEEGEQSCFPGIFVDLHGRGWNWNSLCAVDRRTKSAIAGQTNSIDDGSSIVSNQQGIISNISDENVVQPLLVSTSSMELAAETVALILRIDDIQVSLHIDRSRWRCADGTVH